MRALQQGDVLHDDRYGDLTVVAVIDETASGIGTVVIEVTDGLDAFDVIEGVTVRIGGAA